MNTVKEHGAVNSMRLLWQGFRFGMLLQLAVGPLCLLVFRTTVESGFLSGASVALAVTLVDMLFVALSGFGMAVLLQKPAVQRALKWFGGCVLILFGLNTALGALGVPLLPNIALFSGGNAKSMFWQGVLMTASNPLTILFWSGVLSAKIIEHQLTKRQLLPYGAGCVLSTLLFLLAVALLGLALRSFLPDIVMTLLNIIVGAALIWFGIKMICKRVDAQAQPQTGQPEEQQK